MVANACDLTEAQRLKLVTLLYGAVGVRRRQQTTYEDSWFEVAPDELDLADRLVEKELVVTNRDFPNMIRATAAGAVEAARIDREAEETAARETAVVPPVSEPAVQASDAPAGEVAGTQSNDSTSAIEAKPTVEPKLVLDRNDRKLALPQNSWVSSPPLAPAPCGVRGRGKRRAWTR